MFREQLFLLPPREVLQDDREFGGYGYSLNNYYGNGPIARAKRARFERALRLGKDTFGGRTIDMGAADGLLIPSLAKHYTHVAAIDVDPNAVASSSRVVERLKLPNAVVRSNANISIDELHGQIGSGFQSMYLLETLEHVGEQPKVWDTKIDFLKGCFTLLEPGGKIIISVPKMVGPIMLFKNLLQRSLGKGYDPMTMRQLLKSSLLYDTDELEPLWKGSHVGFNHRKLTGLLKSNFSVTHRRESAISAFYVIAER